MIDSIKNFIPKVREWILENRVETFFLFCILFIGAVLRLYNIAGYMTFLGDEGRDALVVRRLVAEGDLIFVGPGTSIGNMYLGPLYYYMMAPFLLLFNLSPVGPAVMVALLGVITIGFVWYVARKWFPVNSQKINIGALVASFFYAISPTVIIYSRSSWNPNIMPFFSLLLAFSLWKMWQNKSFKWLIVAGGAFAFILQSHYLGLLLLPVIGIFWLLNLVGLVREVGGIKKIGENIREKGTRLQEFVRQSFVGLGVFGFLMSPLFIFDAKHGWRNFAAMQKFFFERQTTVSARPWSSIPNLYPLWLEFTQRIFTGYSEPTGSFFAPFLLIFLLASVLGILFKNRKNLSKTFLTKRKVSESAYLFLFILFLISFVGLGVYKQEIYDHYYGFLYPFPFILFSGIVSFFVRGRKTNYLVVLVLVFLLLKANLESNPLKYPPNNQYQRSVTVSEKMIDESGGESFNIAVIAERNYEGAYQYHLERVGANFEIIDPQRPEETITDQLFVVCELPLEKCDPTHNAKAEVANFGWSEIADSWQVDGVTLFRLIHSQKDDEL